MASARIRRISRIRALKQTALEDRAKELSAAREQLATAEARLLEFVATRAEATAKKDEARRQPIAPDEWRELEEWLDTTHIRERAQRQRIVAHEHAVALARQAVVAAQSEVKSFDELIDRIRTGEIATENSKDRKLEDELAGRRKNR